MNEIKLLDESEIKKNENIIDIKNKNIKNEKNKNGIELLHEKEMKKCGRKELGLTNNCILCQNSNKEIFEKCTNKFIE